METEKESLWERFETWQRNNTVGMTKDRYLEMEEQLGRKPDPSKCPPGVEDLPLSVIEGIEVFNLLGDRVYPEIGYIGKDYTNLPILIDLYNIEDKELLIEVLSRLDAEAIKVSQERLKRQYDKMKSKSRG